VPEAPPQEPSDDTRVAELEQRIFDMKKDVSRRAREIASLEKLLRTRNLAPVNGHFDAEAARVARTAAEGQFYEAAEGMGWLPTKAGSPDFFCVGQDGTIALVVVMPNATSRLRREQLRVMKSIAAAAVPCFRWSPDVGFERFRVGGVLTILEFLRRTRRMSQGMLGEAVGVPQETISAYERGGVRPTAENLQRIGALLLAPGHDPHGLMREVPGSLANELLQGASTRPAPAAVVP